MSFSLLGQVATRLYRWQPLSVSGQQVAPVAADCRGEGSSTCVGAGDSMMLRADASVLHMSISQTGTSPAPSPTQLGHTPAGSGRAPYACTAAWSLISLQTALHTLPVSWPCKRPAWERDGRSRCRAGAACSPPCCSPHAAESIRNDQEAAALQRRGCRLTAAGRRQQLRRQCWQRLAGHGGH